MKSYERQIQIISKLDTLVIFRSLLEDPVLDKLRKLIEEGNHQEFDSNGNIINMELSLSSYSSFVSELFKHSISLSKYVLRLVLNDENIYLLAKSKGEEIHQTLENSLINELKILENISRINSAEIVNYTTYDGYLPPWETEIFDFIEKYNNRISLISTEGYGIYRKHHMFTYGNGNIIPVKYPDQQTLSSLVGYEREKRLVIQNTEALLRGDIASNVLLYGDSGTGKSSTVKAIANFYKDKGLRLVEITKDQLYQLPEIIDTLSENPLKFILFIDDLSFAKNDDNFSTLKAMLEGSVSGKKDNIVIYATSNRRHLVKESLSDRTGDEMFLNDTLQETMSLSARFGLFITYERPRKEKYLEIVKWLADEANVSMDLDQLFIKAEAHALLCGGRSPRVAKQFVELVKNHILI